MLHCIWCKKVNAATAIEHIIPQALGCPDDFVLKEGAVCGSCNNNLGHLDQAVLDEFDVFVFSAGVKGKRGRPPKINSRGNMFGAWEQSGPVIHINTGPTVVKTQGGQVLSAPGKSKRNIKANFQRSGNRAEVSFQIRLGESPKFVRGIVKIAFSSLAFFRPSEVLTDKHDAIRRFVIEGEGLRKIIWMAAPDKKFMNQVRPPLRHESGDYFAISFPLANIDFVVDLSPDMRLFPIFKAKAYQLYGSNGWSWLPL
jgi:hypothetical protein